MAGTFLLVFSYIFSLRVNFFFFLTFLAMAGLRCCTWAVWIGVQSRDCSLFPCEGFLLQWLPLLRSIGSRCAASVVAACHVGSSRNRDQTRVPCTVRWMLNHWTTREALFFPLLSSLLSAYSTQTSWLPGWGRFGLTDASRSGSNVDPF